MLAGARAAPVSTGGSEPGDRNHAVLIYAGLVGELSKTDLTQISRSPCGAALLCSPRSLVHQLMVLAGVIFGGYVAAIVFGSTRGAGGTVVNIRKAVIKRNHFHR
ncbi:hypothetical protein ACWFRJ_44440 [Streptomyces sp. NPDC055239]